MNVYGAMDNFGGIVEIVSGTMYNAYKTMCTLRNLEQFWFF